MGGAVTRPLKAAAGSTCCSRRRSFCRFHARPRRVRESPAASIRRRRACRWARCSCRRQRRTSGCRGLIADGVGFVDDDVHLFACGGDGLPRPGSAQRAEQTTVQSQRMFFVMVFRPSSVSKGNLRGQSIADLLGPGVGRIQPAIGEMVVLQLHGGMIVEVIAQAEGGPVAAPQRRPRSGLL